MRVLHINLARGWRGGERQTLLLMQALRDRGIDSVLAARAKDELARRTRDAGFDVIEIPRPWLLRWGLARSFDLMHAHEARAHQVAAFWKLIVRRPLIATRRVSFVPSTNAFTRFKYAQADRVVAISTGVGNVLTKWGVSSARIDVIPSAISREDYSDQVHVERLRERFAGRRVVGCVASLTAEKDHATLLRAMKLATAAHPNLLTVLVGDGPLRAQLEELARDLGIQVAFEGHQNNPYSYYRVFDAFALCSREEGLGSSILDAFHFGVPVVATNVGGIPDLVRDGETGFLAPAGDVAAIAEKLERVLSDASLRERVIAGARALLEQNFTVNRMADRYAALYESTLNAAQGRA